MGKSGVPITNTCLVFAGPSTVSPIIGKHCETLFHQKLVHLGGLAQKDLYRSVPVVGRGRSRVGSQLILSGLNEDMRHIHNMVDVGGLGQEQDLKCFMSNGWFSFKTVSCPCLQIYQIQT